MLTPRITQVRRPRSLIGSPSTRFKGRTSFCCMTFMLRPWPRCRQSWRTCVDADFHRLRCPHNTSWKMVMKRVLLISYVFPPVGGAGVQRAVKFSKYLPRHGWEVSVLTASNPSVPLFDSSLQNDVPSDTVIERALTLEPSYAAKASVAANSSHRDRWGFRKFIKSVARSTASTLLQPDPQILWAPQAMKRASQLLKSMRHDAIIATAPPFSSLIIGKRLSQKFGLPLVADYRDEWEISNA